MKTRIIVLSLLMSIALGVSARTFFANDEIRVYTDQTYHDSQIHWDWDYSALWLYLFSTENSNNKWIQLEYKESDYFSAIIPEGSNYNRLVLVRKPTGKGEGWSDITNQTCNIRIPDDPSCNVLYKFWKKEGDCTDDAYSEWKTYTPDISQIKSTISGVTQEEISVCPSAAGTLFALHPKIRSDKKDYDYEKVSRHTWLRSTDGKSSWTSLDNFAGKVRDEEKEKDLDTNLPSTIPSGGVYYYLYSLNPSGRRLIHVKVNNVGCDLDCEITAFETANSAVNADNNTFTLDGMVAFGEANGKSLKIECSGKDTIITAPKSPQSFSLHGVPAATVDGQKAMAKASFIGGGAACSMEKEVDIPNATIAADTTTLNQLTGTTYVFIPADTIASNQFVWLRKDENTGIVETIVSAWKKMEVDAISHDSTVTYIYKEYNPAPGSMENLMTNGSYEDSWPYATKKVSEYDYWGTFPETATPPSIDFYTNESVNPGLAKKDNGFAVVRNAKNFAHTYAAVEARDGFNFALFDAKSGSEGANKKAWLATTAMHPKLKLKAGTTYVLSFWAANINNYGEMDNAAEFEFRIEAPGQSTPIAKSKKLNLSDAKFHNNIWHQLSETFTADKDYDNITISVVNLNKKELKVGNDFALDDIQFHPISSVSRNVKSQQIFVAKAHEPKIDAFTATVVQLDCNAEEKYTIQMHVVFQNPKGQLIIKDKTTGTEYPYDVTATFDTPTNLDKDIVINGLTPVNHQWEAYFSEWTSAKRTAETIAPVVPTIEAKNFLFSDPRPGCELTTALTFDLDYTYQQGNLTYWVDDMTTQTATFTPQDRNKQTLAGLTFEGIPADGKNTHVLHVSFDGPNSCVKDYPLPQVPFSPVIDKVEVTGLPTTKLTCSTEEYSFNVIVTTHYDATGHAIALHFDDNGAAKDSVVAATDSKTTVSLKLHNMDDVAQTISVALEEAPTCTKTVDYTPPTLARITPLFDVTISETACDVLEYTLSGTVAFDIPDGKLIVEYDATHRDAITVAAGSSSATFSITGMTATDPGMVLKAWFENSNTPICTVISKPFEAPVIPTIEAKNFTFSAPTCTDVNTTLTFDLDYTYQQGTLTYWVDGLAPQTAASTPQDPSQQTLTGLTFEGIPADGKDNHVLHVSFDGPNSCVKDFALPQVPFSPVIDAVTLTAVPTLVPCDATAYEITVSFTSYFTPVPADKQIVLTYDSIGETKTTAPIALTNFPYNLIVYNIANGSHSIFAAFADAADCKTETTYDAPARETCERDSVTICEGESYWWHEAYRTGPVGENRFKDGSDSLYLFVKEKPTVTIGTIAMTCDEANEIRIPFSAVKGDPDQFDIDIVGNHFTGRLDIVGTDTAFVFSPTTMEAGDYTAHVTVGETDVPCTSMVDIHFTIALSGQMYSKWTDVLFIGNKEGRFTSYQWFADGVAMSGESLQHLYDPKGLSGSTILYHCRLTTTDGKTLYTCPQTFDDVTPSRTVDTTPNKVKATTLYDTIGRVIKGMPHNGIYIVMEELENGEIRTHKITVYE